MMRKSTRETIGVQLGYAAAPSGDGIVYARLRSNAGERLVRASFRVKRFAGLDGREVGYAALDAMAEYLCDRKIESASFELPEEALVEDLRTHRDLPFPLVLPYVRLRCRLNRFRDFTVSALQNESDLSHRARAEVALHSAA